ncbi:hypothetical protein AAMO2058_000313700 [Amorphochlora amoebiformis]
MGGPPAISPLFLGLTAAALPPQGLRMAQNTVRFQAVSLSPQRWGIYQRRMSTWTGQDEAIKGEVERHRGIKNKKIGSLKHSIPLAMGSMVVGVRGATAAVVEEGARHVPLGEKLATLLQSKGIPSELVLMSISAMPVVELRGGIPVGRLLGIPAVNNFALCAIGNYLPVLPILLIGKSKAVTKLLEKPLERARKKFGSGGVDEWTLAISLALFVGIPVPGTGAWTGSLAAVALGLPIGKALVANGVGILVAATIMTALTSSLKAGLIVGAATVFAAFSVDRLRKELSTRL